MKMKSIFRAIGVAPIMAATLVGCGGGGGDSSGSVTEEQVEIKGLAASLNLSACIDSDGDYECDTQEVSPENLTVPSDADEDELILIKILPPEDIGASAFATFDGERTLAVPAKELSASPIDALAYGLWLYVQDILESSSPAMLTSEGAAALTLTVKNLEDARKYLKDKFNLDGSGQQNEAILQALNNNLERLGFQEMELDQAFPADIKAMAESLINLTVQSQSICDRYPEYCNTNGSDDSFPVIDLSSIQPFTAQAPTGADCIRYEYGNCVEWAGPIQVDVIYSDILQFNQHKAAEIAYQTREKSGDSNAIDAAIDALQCGIDEVKNVYMYGLADNFVTNNTELPNPQGAAAAVANNFANSGGNVSNYDYHADLNNPAYFLETLSNVPSSINSGNLIIGLKENGYTMGNTTIFNNFVNIGEVVSQTLDFYTDSAQDIRSNWNAFSNDIYSEDLSSLSLTSGNGSVLTRFQAGQEVSVLTGSMTNVDFIAIAACQSRPVSDRPSVTTTLNNIKEKFICEGDDSYVEVVGGDFDDFNGGADATTSGAYLSSFAMIDYDTAVNKQQTLADSLSIAFANQNVTKAQFAINTRPSLQGAVNDYIALGDISSGSMVSPYLAAAHPTNGSPYSTEYPVMNGGTLKVINENKPFQNITSSTQTISGDMLSMLNSGTSNFDLIVGEQTEVDGAVLMMCLSSECIDTDGDGFCDDEEKEQGSDPTNPNSTPNDIDGDGVLNDEDCAPEDPTLSVDCDVTTVDGLPLSCNQVIEMDLRDANVWVDTATGNAPTENNVFDNTQYAGIVWDGAMNWFDFGNAGNAEHELRIDFCSCGGGKVEIDQMKSDNYSKIYLDNDPNPTAYPQMGSNYIVSRADGISQSTMASWGTNVSGSAVISPTGNGSDHTLYFKVKNGFGPSGGAVNGTLRIEGGHLGKCTTEDVLDSGTGVVIEDGPVVVSVDGSAVEVGDIQVEEGPAGGYSISMYSAVAINKLDEDGKLVTDLNPNPVVINANPGNSEPTGQTAFPEYEHWTVHCNAGFIDVAWADPFGINVYETSIPCSGDWTFGQ